jgi:site-specific DNA recombinase
MRSTTQPAAALRAIGYARVSTSGQAVDGVSLDAQRAKIEAMASLQDMELVDVVIDGGASAKTLDRPGLSSVLALVRARAVDCIVIAKLDRLTRSVRDLADLLDTFRRYDVALVSVAESLDTKSAAGRLVLNIMSSVSQWEREAIGERTREALAHKRARGERVGQVPYGSQLAADGVTLEACAAELATLDRMRALRASGLTLAATAAVLNREGHSTRRGSAWTSTTVHQMTRGAAVSAPRSRTARQAA